MKQIIHILRKDIRHHWPEIVLSLAALAGRCWHDVTIWSHERSRIAFWSTVIEVLVPITWGILVLRVIQSEPLVGDRQFWITRPYEWKKLLAAKLLFIVLFINVPLIIAGIVLLAKAGFPSPRYLLGLLWMQLLLIQVPLLPMAALASVTRNILQTLLALVAVALYMAGMIALDEVLPRASGSALDNTDFVQGMILVTTAIVVLWLQYAYRKTSSARILFVSGAAALTLVVIATAYLSRQQDPFPFPAVGQQSSLRAALDPVKPEPPKNPPEREAAVHISIPVTVSGLSPGLVAHVVGVRLTVQAPDGFRWNSDWDSRYQLLGVDENRWNQNFEMQYKIFERLKSVPLKAEVSIAAAIFRDEKAMQIPAANGEFAVPGVGRCRIDGERAGLHCHSPLVKPSMVLVTTEPGESTCPADADRRAMIRPGAVPYAWESGGDSWAEYGVSPIEYFSLYLGAGARLCTGTPLRFSFPVLIEHIRTNFEISGLKLEDYRHDGLFNFTFSSRK